MKKIIPIGFLVLIVAAGGGLYSVWNNHAEEAKQNVTAALAQLNGENGKLEYEAITTSGFPTALNIAIVNPHFSLQTSKLITKFSPPESLANKQIPEIIQDYKLDGNIVVSVNALSNNYKIITTGNWSGTDTIAGKTTAIASISTGETVCELNLKNSTKGPSDLWNLNAIGEDKENFAQNFRKFSCETPSNNWVSGDNKEVIFSSAGNIISITNEPSGDLVNINFYLKFSDYEITKAGDDIVSSYMQAFGQPQPYTFSSFGKNNAEIDIAYSGSKDWANAKENIKTKPMPLDIKVKKFEVSNNSGATSFSFSANHILKDGIRDAAISYKIESKVTDLYRDYLNTSIANLLKTPEYEKLINPEIKEKIAALSSGELDSLAISVIPDFASLGKMVIGIDLTYHGDDSFTDSELTMPSFELSATPYGITAKGAVKRTKDQMIPSGNLSVSCANCLQMIDDSVAYFERVKSAIATIEPSKVTGLEIDPRTVQAVKNFLLKLAQTKETGEQNPLVFELISNAGAQPTINGKSIAEVSALFQEFIAPTLGNKTAAPASEPALAAPTGK